MTPVQSQTQVQVPSQSPSHRGSFSLGFRIDRFVPEFFDKSQSPSHRGSFSLSYIQRSAFTEAETGLNPLRIGARSLSGIQAWSGDLFCRRLNPLRIGARSLSLRRSQI